jgi:hypothetical protein
MFLFMLLIKNMRFHKKSIYIKNKIYIKNLYFSLEFKFLKIFIVITT